jgi:hypothetical protein
MVYILNVMIALIKYLKIQCSLFPSFEQIIDKEELEDTNCSNNVIIVKPPRLRREVDPRTQTYLD